MLQQFLYFTQNVGTLSHADHSSSGLRIAYNTLCKRSYIYTVDRLGGQSFFKLKYLFRRSVSNPVQFQAKHFQEPSLPLGEGIELIYTEKNLNK